MIISMAVLGVMFTDELLNDSPFELGLTADVQGSIDWDIITQAGILFMHNNGSKMTKGIKGNG